MFEHLVSHGKEQCQTCSDAIANLLHKREILLMHALAWLPNWTRMQCDALNCAAHEGTLSTPSAAALQEAYSDTSPYTISTD